MERRVSFPLVPDAPSRAREVVGRELASLSTKVREDATLLVSELITNAVRHAPTSPRPEVELRIRSGSGRVRVVVADPGAGFVPTPRLPTISDGSGWGLYLVDRIADRWGVLTEEQTEVWFEIDLDDGDRATRSGS
ncbi:MAG TPA: ATP-binding protein [Actinomycetota bacterium]|nr:ATP-binding protein [Actinomycetota bacterium]